MKRLQDLQGELLIDQRNAPGIPVELLKQLDLPLELAQHSKIHEFATYTCKHCQKGIVVDRNSQAEKAIFCKGCNHMICTGCAIVKHKTGVCRTFDQVADEMLNKAALTA